MLLLLYAAVSLGEVVSLVVGLGAEFRVALTWSLWWLLPWVEAEEPEWSAVVQLS